MKAPRARPSRSRPGWDHWLALLAPLALGLALLHARAAPVEWARNALFDFYQRLDPRPWSPNLPVRVIDVDEASLARYGQWPWPRARIADLVDRLKQLGVAVIAFDMVFSEQDRLSPQQALAALPDVPQKAALARAIAASEDDGDAALAQAIAGARVALGFVLTNGGGGAPPPPKWGVASAGDDPLLFLPRFNRALLPLPALAAAAAGLGSLNFRPERDLIVRKLPVLLAVGPPGRAVVAPSLAAEALRLAQGASTYEIRSSNASGEAGLGAQTGIVSVRIGALQIPTEADGGLRIRFSGADAQRAIPAWTVLAGTAPAAALRGRIALIGTSAAGLGDLRSTPLAAAVPGVQVQAEAIETIAAGVALERPDFALGAETVLLVLGGLVCGWLGRARRPLPAALAALMLATGALAASWFAFSRASLLLDPLPSIGTWIATWSACTVVAFRRAERERRFVREAFSRYVSPAVVERLAADPSRIRLGGEARAISVLFCDLRGFTARAETMTAAEVVSFLNAVHTPLTRIALAEAGTVDKYLGDGFMAFWNAPVDVSDHIARACRAALAIHALAPELDRREAEAAAASGRPHQPVRFGIGLTTGEAFVGNMGSEQRFDYSAVGDPVNTASRLESACDEIGAPILVSRAVAAGAPAFLFVELGLAALKGKSEPTPVFALHAGPERRDAAFEAFIALHRAARAAAAAADVEALQRVCERLAADADGARYRRFYERLICDASAPAPAQP